MTSEKREKAIAFLNDEIRSLRLAPTINGCGMKPEWAEQLEIMETCLEAVKGHGNKPLTLEQLREMDGKPVWVECLEDLNRSGWRLIFWDRGKYLVLLHTSLYGFLLDDYGKTWLAYAYPPAHIDREAWEPCEVCGEKDPFGNPKFSHHFVVDESSLYFCDSDFGWEGEKIKFCPFCSRPLTEEAWAELEKRMWVMG